MQREERASGSWLVSWRAAGEVASRLGSRACRVQRGSMMSELPAQPPPTAQSVLWRPAIQELAPPEGDTSLIFIAQRTLAAVEDHLVGALHRPLLGYLVGRVLQAPDTGMSYVVAHGVVRVPQVIADGATEQLVGDTLAAAQRLLPPEHGVVVGWYRSDPTRSEEHTSELQSQSNLVCRLLLEKKKQRHTHRYRGTAVTHGR